MYIPRLASSTAEERFSSFLPLVDSRKGPGFEPQMSAVYRGVLEQEEAYLLYPNPLQDVFAYKRLLVAERLNK